MKILIVDDEPAIRMIYEMMLLQSGYDVLTAETSKRAIELLKIYNDIALAMVDLSLPDTKETELIEKMQSFATVKIIAMSGIITPEMAAKLSRLNLVAIVAKPTSKIELINCIKEALTEWPARSHKEHSVR